MITTTDNRYNGRVIDNTTLPEDAEEFRREISRIVANSQNKELLWIKVPIEKSEFIPILTPLDFEFHHCDEKSLTLIKKLKPAPLIPTTKNFIVGVGAIVINKGKLLVVKDNFYNGFKLPGGHIDKNESIKDALKREVAEETGVSVEFESIVNIGHFINGQFGASNLYIVCTAKAHSSEIVIHDALEIAEAKWMDPTDFINASDVNEYNKSVVKAAIGNKELKLTEQKITLKRPNGEVFF